MRHRNLGSPCFLHSHYNTVSAIVTLRNPTLPPPRSVTRQGASENQIVGFSFSARSATNPGAGGIGVSSRCYPVREPRAGRFTDHDHSSNYCGGDGGSQCNGQRPCAGCECRGSQAERMGAQFGVFVAGDASSALGNRMEARIPQASVLHRLAVGSIPSNRNDIGLRW